MEQFFNQPRREPPVQNIQYPQGVLTQFQAIHQYGENSYAPTNRGKQGSYAMLYST